MPDLYQTVTNKIISQLERTDLGQWTTPWHRNSEMPRSGDGRPYRGVNILVLWSAAIERNYTSPVWATYKQWAKHKCQVRRGERAEIATLGEGGANTDVDGNTSRGVDRTGGGGLRRVPRRHLGHRWDVVWIDRELRPRDEILRDRTGPGQVVEDRHRLHRRVAELLPQCFEERLLCVARLNHDLWSGQSAAGLRPRGTLGEQSEPCGDARSRNQTYVHGG